MRSSWSGRSPRRAGEGRSLRCRSRCAPTRPTRHRAMGTTSRARSCRRPTAPTRRGVRGRGRGARRERRASTGSARPHASCGERSTPAFARRTAGAPSAPTGQEALDVGAEGGAPGWRRSPGASARLALGEGAGVALSPSSSHRNGSIWSAKRPTWGGAVRFGPTTLAPDRPRRLRRASGMDGSGIATVGGGSGGGGGAPTQPATPDTTTSVSAGPSPQVKSRARRETGEARTSSHGAEHADFSARCHAIPGPRRGWRRGRRPSW